MCSVPAARTDLGPVDSACDLADDVLGDLTAREREVMSLAAEGLSNDEIAARLVLSTHTVRTHIQRSMMKLHARDRAQLVVIA